MKRRHISTTERVSIFQRTGGVCHLCSGRIQVGEGWEVEHIIPLSMGGDDFGDNLAPAHVKCHRGKTKKDRGDLARAERREARHLGAKRTSRPLPGSKASGIRIRMNRNVEKW